MMAATALSASCKGPKRVDVGNADVPFPCGLFENLVIGCEMLILAAGVLGLETGFGVRKRVQKVCFGLFWVV